MIYTAKLYLLRSRVQVKTSIKMVKMGQYTKQEIVLWNCFFMVDSQKRR